MGEGARVAGVPLGFAFGGSEKERDFEGVLAGETVAIGGPWEGVSSTATSIVSFACLSVVRGRVYGATALRR